MSKAWPKVRLGEVLRQCDTAVPVSKLNEVNLAGVYSFGRGLFKRAPMYPSKTSYKSYNRLTTDDFVISTPKAWEGALARVTPEFEGWYLSPVFPTFRSDCQKLLPEFIEWFCKRESVWTELQQKSRGIGARRESVHPNQFLSLEIPLPPLAEQRRIVARIEELSAQINEALTLRQQSSEETEALVAASVSMLCFKGSEIGRFEEYLVEAKNGIYKPSFACGRGTPCLRMYNIDGPALNMHNLQLLEVSAEELENYGCVEGDLIFNRVNSAELVGKTGIVPAGFPQVTFESKNMRLRVDRTRMIPRFAAIVLNSAPIRRYYRSVLKQQCGMATLNQEHVRNIPFPRFSLTEQQRMVDELDALQTEADRLKLFQSETAAELDALLPAILDRAFKGEL